MGGLKRYKCDFHFGYKLAPRMVAHRSDCEVWETKDFDFKTGECKVKQWRFSLNLPKGDARIPA